MNKQRVIDAHIYSKVVYNNQYKCVKLMEWVINHMKIFK